MSTETIGYTMQTEAPVVLAGRVFTVETQTMDSGRDKFQRPVRVLLIGDSIEEITGK